MLYFQHDFYRAAGGLFVLVDLNLHGYFFLHLFSMADGTHLTVVGFVQRAERIDSFGQRFTAQRAESLVNKQCLHLQTLPYLAQCQSQSQGDKETFTTGDGARRTHHTTLVSIFHENDEFLSRHGMQGISVGEGAHVNIGFIRMLIQLFDIAFVQRNQGMVMDLK